MPKHRYPLSLSDDQLQTVMLAAASLPVSRRHSFLLHVSQTLNVSRPDRLYPPDALLGKAIDKALQEPAHG